MVITDDDVAGLPRFFDEIMKHIPSVKDDGLIEYLRVGVKPVEDLFQTSPLSLHSECGLHRMHIAVNFTRPYCKSSGLVAEDFTTPWTTRRYDVSNMWLDKRF